MRWAPNHVGAGIAWRYVAHAIMLGLCLFNEARPAPHLPDLILDRFDPVEWLSRWNYSLWLAAYVPIALCLWRSDRSRFVHFLYVGGVISLLRGVCINLTGLGPVTGLDLNAGLNFADGVSAWWSVVNPLAAFGDAPHLALTKDLFFSGHTATTFLLYLYARPIPKLGAAALVGHLVTVSVVVFSHLHYTIDIVGAWAITYCVYRITTERWPPQRFFPNQSTGGPTSMGQS